MDQAVGRIGFDRSRVRILLCDKDPATAQEVKDLLCRCSYQVSVVKSARQVVEVLNLVDSKVDLVLAEVELPNGKGFKMLRHIVKTDTFKHIPIVMMSARDEMAIVVKCLRLGAADYLVKPLRINELLNLWTHMWRRRRMLGLTEKHIVKGHLVTKNIIAEIFVSDTSESNTISTDILSEDSNDALFKAKESNLRTISEEQQLDTSPELELTLTMSKENRAPEVSGRKLSPPRRTELKLGQSSAFLSYAKAVSRTAVTERPESATNEGPSCSNPNVQPPLQLNGDNEKQLEPAGRTPRNSEGPAAAEMNQFHPEVQWNSASVSRNEAPVQWSDEAARRREGGDQYSVMQVCPQNTGPIYNQLPQSHLMPQLMVAHSLHHPSTLLQPALHYYQAVQPENVAAMHSAPPAFSYYPFPIHVPPHQVGPWATPLAAQNANERKAGAERREAALNKFRQKRKDRCFEKKIRYASRKRLAEQRPRIKGQFVRRTEDCEEEDDDDEETARDMSPESGVETQQVYSTALS